MSYQTSENAVLEPTIDQLSNLSCVDDVSKHGTGDDTKLVATVPDSLARETLKAELNDIITPVYVDIQKSA